MKFILDRETLGEILKQIKGIPPTKPLDPVHGDIQISIEEDGAGGALARFNAVDKNFAVHVSALMGVISTDGYGVMAMPADKISDIAIKAYSDEITFNYDESAHSLKVKSGKRTATIRGHNPEDFPSLPKPQGTPMQINLDLLADSVLKVVHAAGYEREITMGIHFDVYEGELTTACLDGQRVVASFNRKLQGNPPDATALIRAGEMKQVVGLFDALSNVKDIEVYIEENYVYLSSDSLMARVAQISAKFPDFRLMFPDDISNGFMATVNCRALISAVDWASTVDNLRIELDFLTSGEIRVSSHSQETGDASESVTAHVQGSDCGMVTFANLLLAQLRLMANIGFENVILHAANSAMPLVIRPEPDDEGLGEDYMAIVMPIAGKTRYQQEG